MQKIPAEILFVFELAIMDLLIALKYLNFANIVPRGVSACKIPTF